MKVIIECQNCGAITEFAQETIGNISYTFNHNENFYCSDKDIELWASDKDDIESLDELDKELKSIRIDCKNCGDYIELHF